MDFVSPAASKESVGNCSVEDIESKGVTSSLELASAALTMTALEVASAAVVWAAEVADTCEDEDGSSAIVVDAIRESTTVGRTCCTEDASSSPVLTVE